MPRLNDIQDAEEMRFLADQLEKWIKKTPNMSRPEALEVWDNVITHLEEMNARLFADQVKQDLIYEALVQRELDVMSQ